MLTDHALRDGWKTTKVVEAALALGDAQQRRALVLTLRHSDRNSALDKALARIAVAVPEGRPAVEWIKVGTR